MKPLSHIMQVEISGDKRMPVSRNNRKKGPPFRIVGQDCYYDMVPVVTGSRRPSNSRDPLRLFAPDNLKDC